MLSWRRLSLRGSHSSRQSRLRRESRQRRQSRHLSHSYAALVVPVLHSHRGQTHSGGVLVHLPAHRFIHFAFRGRDYRLMSFRVREILRLHDSPIRIHNVFYGHTEPPRRPHSGLVPPTDLVCLASQSHSVGGRAGHLGILLLQPDC